MSSDHIYKYTDWKKNDDWKKEYVWIITTTERVISRIVIHADLNQKKFSQLT